LPVARTPNSGRDGAVVRRLAVVQGELGHYGMYVRCKSPQCLGPPKFAPPADREVGDSRRDAPPSLPNWAPTPLNRVPRTTARSVTWLGPEHGSVPGVCRRGGLHQWPSGPAGYLGQLAGPPAR